MVNNTHNIKIWQLSFQIIVHIERMKHYIIIKTLSHKYGNTFISLREYYGRQFKIFSVLNYECQIICSDIIFFTLSKYSQKMIHLLKVF